MAMKHSASSHVLSRVKTVTRLSKLSLASLDSEYSDATSNYTNQSQPAHVPNSQLVQSAINLYVTLVANRNNPVTIILPNQCEILSTNSRAITVAMQTPRDKTVVIRVSPYIDQTPKSTSPSSSRSHYVTARDLAGSHQSAQRILLFGRNLAAQKQQPVRGIVPFIHEPILVDNQLVVEQYEQIVASPSDNTRMDLHAFVQSSTDRDDSSDRMLRSFAYLLDVLEGVKSMHEMGWVHMDLSFENVVVSDDRAFLIDFESTLPFGTERDGCMRRGDLHVPVKTLLVPPEHYLSRPADLLSLPAYDVWAFGVMIFSLMFQEYLFASETILSDLTGRTRTIPNQRQLDHFMKNGFRRYLEMYHKSKYDLLFSKSETPEAMYFRLCGDLLAKIFRRPCQVVLDQPASDTHSCYSYSSETQAPIFYCDCHRLTVHEISDHPLWEFLGLRSKKGSRSPR